MVALARHGVMAAGVLAAMLVIAALAGLAERGTAPLVFLFSALLTVFFAVAVHFGTRSRPGKLDRAGALTLLALMWLGIPTLAALPIAATTSLGAVGSWFEAVSALTTTGASQVHEAELPRATLVWLLSLQWFGGLLSLVGYIAVLAPSGAGGLPNHAAGLAEFGQGEGAGIEGTVQQVLPIYAAATVLCMVILFALGLKGFEAFGLASAAVSTGGLLPDNDGMAAYGDPAVKFVMIVFMLVGGTSILWHRMLLTRRFRQAFSQHENLLVLGLSAAVGIYAAAAWFRTPLGGESLPIAIEDGLFTAVSLVTTTGIEPHAGAFNTLPVTLVMMLVFIGGATFSTSGGIKMYRASAMVLQSLRELHRLIHPHAVRPSRLGRQSISLEGMKAIWLCFAVTCIVFVIIGAAIAPAMPSFEAAYVGALAALTNTGPVYLAGWNATAIWPEWDMLPDYARIILAFAMILGRLEILVVLGLVHFVFWRH
ncbi:TrkH family potassium uptake protein [Ancylobacter terrae]|uniref:TrkH family potassium uptake protein n=1 Tax=Ancylobacter sp. sgz301288 TaxID=3342077 RepID=UPI00385B3004